MGLDRSVTYNVLDNLLEKGLVSYVIKSGKKFFLAASPENLLTPLKGKGFFIKEIIPKLKKLQKIPEVERTVEVYEGKEGLKSFTLELLKFDEFYILNATGKIFEVLEYFGPKIIKNLIEKTKVKIIAIQEAKETDLMKLRAKIRFLPKEFTNYATTFIYGNKIAFQIIIEKPLIIIIENQIIAEGYKKDFEFIWKWIGE